MRFAAAYRNGLYRFGQFWFARARRISTIPLTYRSASQSFRAPLPHPCCSAATNYVARPRVTLVAFGLLNSSDGYVKCRDGCDMGQGVGRLACALTPCVPENDT